MNQTSSTENVGEKPPGFFFALRHPCRLAVTVRRIRDDTSEVLEHFGEETTGKDAVYFDEGNPVFNLQNPLVFQCSEMGPVYNLYNTYNY